MSKVRSMTRGAKRAATKLAVAPEPMRFRFAGLQVQVQIDVLNPEGKVRQRALLANEQGVVSLQFAEEHIDKLDRAALMGILLEAGIAPTD